MIAAGCLFLTLKHRRVSLSGSETLLAQIHMIINDFVDLDCLLQFIEQIDELIKEELKIDINFEASSCASTRVLAKSTNVISTKTTLTTTTSTKMTSIVCYEASVDMKENDFL